MKPSRYVADFDSTTGMINALSAVLHGRDWPLVGVMPPALLPVLRPVAKLIDSAPVRLREKLWNWSGWLEALPASQTGEINSEDVSRFLLERYSRERQYPAVMIGSARGDDPPGRVTGCALAAAELPGAGAKRRVPDTPTTRSPRSSRPSSRPGGCSKPTRTSPCTRCMTPIRTGQCSTTCTSSG